MAIAMTATAQPTVHYTLGMSKPSTHLLEIGMDVSGLSSGDKTIDVQMPAWRTGRYVIFDFAGGVVDFAATDGSGKTLPWEKVDKQTWRISKGNSKSLSVRYTVYANEFNQRTRGLNAEHAFVDPATSFMYIESLQKHPLTLDVKPYGSWKVTTGLDPVAGMANRFKAQSYEYFADCPIEVGSQKEFTFEVDGVPHVWMMAGEGNYEIDKLIADTKKIVSANKAFWGNLPYQRYIFMLHLSPTSGGGTEHINSTIMGTRPFGFKNTGSYRGFLGLVSHEYFHTWNVKQLRPAGITPYDFSRENYSREYWVAEGTTSYYTGIILLRAGLATADEYIGRLGGEIRDDRIRPGNTKQSIAESSFDAWVKYWKSNPQAFNTESDYYDKGSNVSLLMSMEVLLRTQGKRSLDEVMRAMFERYRVGKKGYTLADMQKTCEEIAGGSFAEFFAKYVTGTDPLPWEDALRVVGLDVKAADDSKPTLGAWLNESNGRVLVLRVYAGGVAEAAGLDVNDEVIAFNGYRARLQDMTARMGEMKPGDVVTLTVFRNEKLHVVAIPLGRQEVPTYSVTRTSNPSDTQKTAYEKWLGVPWPPAQTK